MCQELFKSHSHMFVHLHLSLVPIIHNSHNLTDINHLSFSLHIARQMRANIFRLSSDGSAHTLLIQFRCLFSGHSLAFPLVATSNIPHIDHLTLISFLIIPRNSQHFEKHVVFLWEHRLFEISQVIPSSWE